jgi:hypothetical protein
MDKSISLLQEYPDYILTPDVQLTKTDEGKEKDVEEGPFKCISCGKDLVFPYFVTIGIPPSPLLIDTEIVNSKDDEKDVGKYIISQVKDQATQSGIENKYQWIFTEQNILSSKRRECSDCHVEYDFRYPQGMRIDRVFDAVKEYQRLHTPINSAKSNYERYIISLPDRRSKVNWEHIFEYGEYDDFPCGSDEEESIRIHLKIALDPSYESPYYSKSQEMRADLIQDKDRTIPNDQELTRWMQKYERIQFCKIFRNPKIFGKTIYNKHTEYTVIVHYPASEDNLKWEEYDI